MRVIGREIERAIHRECDIPRQLIHLLSCFVARSATVMSSAKTDSSSECKTNAPFIPISMGE